MANWEIIHGHIDDIEELKKFTQALHDTVTSLTKKLTKLEADKKHLEGLLAQTAPVISTGEETELEGPFTSEEEAIARKQLQLFNERSKQGELTIEETRKVEIYSKILLSFRNADKKIKNPAEGVPASDLLKLLEGGKES